MGYFPAQTYGGPPVSIHNFCNLLINDFEFFIVCRDHELNGITKLKNIHEGWNLRSECKVKYLSEKESNYFGYKRIMDEIKPDIVYINSLFARETAKFVLLCHINRVKYIIAPRGELCVNAFDKKIIKVPYIFILKPFFNSRLAWFQSTSEEETSQLVKLISVKRERIIELTNIASVPHSGNSKTEKFSGSCKLVFISRIQSKKNLLFALRLLKNIKSQVTYDIYGPLENHEYWDTCCQVIKELPVNITVNYRGALKHEEVGATFSKYDAFLFPTLSENYGHVIVESMLNDCPVITSDQVPWTDVNENNAGWSIALEKEQEFINAIESISQMNQDEYNHLLKRNREYIQSKIDFISLHDEYRESFDEIYNS